MKVMQYIIGKWGYMYRKCMFVSKREKGKRLLNIYSRIKFCYFN